MQTLFTKFIIFLSVSIFLAGCATKKISWAPTDKIQSVTFKNNKPASITLLTMINNHTGVGGHSALLINANERILFDPAGTFIHPQIPERHDVLYGISDAALERYVDYHARPSIHVVMQKIEVDPKIALDISEKVQNYGPVQDMMCSFAISDILSKNKIFRAIPKTIFPKNTMNSFANLKVDKTTIIYDYFEDDETNIFLEKQSQKK